MKECNCNTVEHRDLKEEDGRLKHTVCNGYFDPAAKIINEQRDTPAGPHLPNVEYRDE